MNKIIHGDSLEVLKTLESGSVDVVCTDPPYGYSFMGKSWDKTLPDIGIFKECLRVLKPGAFAFVMSAPRSDVCSRMMLMLEDAGFEIGFTPIYWTYASGFPKAMNIGKIVDKRGGLSKADEVKFTTYLRSVKGGRKNAEIDAYLGLTTGAFHYFALSDSNRLIPPWSQYEKLKVLLGLSDEWDAFVKEVEREVISRQKMTFGIGGASERMGSEKVIDKPATDLDGSYGGFQPKPAVEVIIVAMKPLSEKTYVDQALKNGKGVTWLDDCRIPTADAYSYPNGPGGKHANPMDWEKDANRNEPQSSDKRGRFPANLLASDDVLNDGLDRKSTGGKNGAKSSVYGAYGSPVGEAGLGGYGDSGSYSRFFSLDAWASTLPFLIVPKASKREKNKGLDHLERKGPPVHDFRPTLANNPENWKTPIEETPYGGANRGGNAANNHPTVKPIKLMSYLITLGSRPGDVVLDPFLGSGTTAVAAKELGRQFIGIEREKEYVEIAEARIDSVQPTLL